MAMPLRLAEAIVKEPKYLEALKVIAEAEAAEVAEAVEPVEEPVENQEPSN